MTLTVQTLDEATVNRWDEYVQRAEGATFFHRAGWKEVLERASDIVAPEVALSRGSAVDPGARSRHVVRRPDTGARSERRAGVSEPSALQGGAGREVS